MPFEIPSGIDAVDYFLREDAERKRNPKKKSNVEIKSEQDAEKQSRQREVEYSAAREFFGSAKIRNTDKNETDMAEKHKGNVLLVATSRKMGAAILADPCTKLPIYRCEFDAATKDYLTESEGGRTSFTSKLLVTSQSVSWLNPAYNYEEATLPIYSHSVRYGKGPTKPNSGDDHLLGITEAYQIFDQLQRELDMVLPTSGELNGKCMIANFVSDSGGSTQATQGFMGQYFLTLGRRDVIFWPSRCRVHQGNIISKDLSYQFLSLSNVRIAQWEKKLHCAALAVSAKKEEIVTNLTGQMNRSVHSVESLDGISADCKSKSVVISDLGYSAEKYEILRKGAWRGEEVWISKGDYSNYRKAVAGLYSRVPIMVWSRWCSTTLCIGRMLIIISHFLFTVVGRLFGDQIRIKDVDYNNPFKTGKDADVAERVTLFLSAYFIRHIATPAEKYLAYELADEKLSRSNANEKYQTWTKERLAILRDEERLHRDVSDIFGEDVAVKQKSQVRKHSVVAQLSCHTGLLTFDWRYGPNRDVHECFLEDYNNGEAEVEDLLVKDYTSDIYKGDPGAVALWTIQRRILQFDSAESRATELENIMGRLSSISRDSKECELKIGRLKRASKKDRSIRSIQSADTVTNHSYVYSDSKEPDVRELNEKPRKQPKTARYLNVRPYDMMKTHRYSEMQIGGENRITTAANKWTNGQERQRFGILAHVEDLRRESDAKEEAMAAVVQQEDEWGEEDVVPEGDDPPHPRVTAMLKKHFRELKKQVITAWAIPQNTKAECKRRLDYECLRWKQGCHTKPFDYVRASRQVSSIERTVCKVIRDDKKARKTVLDAGDDLIHENVTSVAQVEIGGEDQPPEDEIDEPDDIFSPAIYALEVPQFLRFSGVAMEGIDIRGFWIILRTDLKCSDFSCFRLDPTDGSDDYEINPDKWFHSPRIMQTLESVKNDFRVHTASVICSGEDLKLRFRLTGKIDVKRAQAKKAKGETRSALDKTETAEDDFFARILREDKAKTKRKNQVKGKVKTVAVSKSVASDGSSSSRIERYPGELPMPENTGVTRYVENKKREKNDADGIAINPAPNPKRPKALKPKFEVTPEISAQISQARREVNRRAREYQIEGYKIEDASSLATYRASGRFTDRVKVLPTLAADRKRFLEIVTTTAMDMCCRSEKHAVSYHKYASSCVPGLIHAALWALRTRFIVDRSDAILEDPLFKNTAEQMLTVSKEFKAEVLDNVPTYVAGIVKKMQGADLKKIKALQELDAETACSLVPLYEKREFEDWQDWMASAESRYVIE